MVTMVKTCVVYSSTVHMGRGCWLNLQVPALLVFPSQPDPVCLLQLSGSVGLNIFSAICSAVGIMLFITDISVSAGYVYPGHYPYQGDLGVVSVLKQSSLPLFSYVQTMPERA